ncbi:hypothetical protein CYR83_04220 [Ligilactobacillus agilis]|uniref:Uncharacterized protein n=1 Tax=Ligilactobacillus agilis TaxID=1601 RepID=A0A2I2ACL6_9LACO|nr:hypothetical protein [Ligilactobacillus agilis]PLA77077.1 hypothetical protein CYR79_02790 [Ligilactobacillus agilis]PLA83316.1 hypothetical protein CYR83_04220 [Ligilactobacillus agilis]
MAKKNFSNLNNPADMFLNEIEQVQVLSEEFKNEKDNHVSKKTNEVLESKSQHVSLLLKPSTAKNLKYIAKFEGISVNEIANRLLDGYVDEYRTDEKKAAKIDQAIELFD